MQSPSKGRTEPERTAAETSLGRCLVDGNAATNSGDRRRRRKALGISFAIEATVLALLVVIPLMTTVAQPHFRGTAFVPFIFDGTHPRTPTGHTPAGNRHSPTVSDQRVKFITDQAPPRPAHIAELGNDTPISDLSASIDFNDRPVLLGLQPTHPVVRPPDEKMKSEERRAVKVSGPVEQAQLIARVEPRYPILAVQARKEGTVVLHAIISRDGRITALEVVSGPPLFVQAALDAVRQWRYRPTALNGEPVEVDTSIMVIFRLTQ
jgi:protein TonB